MFGHNDVANQGKFVASARFFERLYGKISGADSPKQGPPLIATEGDEMQITMAGKALEVFGHRSEERPTLCTLRKG